MNKILTNIVFMIIAVIIIVVLGNLFFLSNLDNEINNVESNIAINRTNLEKLRSDLDKLSNEKPNTKNAPRLVSIGQEGQLMKLFLDSGKFKSPLKINTYDLFKAYYYKPENTDENSNNDNNSSNQGNTVENVSTLDENGMPVNAYTQDEYEWKGLEIVPIKITFAQEPKYMSNTLKLLQSLPVNAIRAADFVFDRNLIRGTLILAFPLNEQ